MKILPYDQSTIALAASRRSDIITLFAERVRRSPTRCAIACDDNEVSFEDFWQNSVAAAKSLIEAGFVRGDRVGVLLPTSVVAAYAAFGALMAGAIPLLIHARYRASELAHVIKDARIRGLVTDTEHPILPFRERLNEAIGQTVLPKREAPATVGIQRVDHGLALRLETVFSVDSSAKDWRPSETEQTKASALDPAAFRAELARRADFRSLCDPALILYTSGTTGVAKGVVLSHEALVGNPIELGRTRFGLDEGESIWQPLPFYHIAGIGTLIGAIEAGAMWVSPAHYSPENAADTLARYRPSVIYPTWQAITDSLFAEIHRRRFTMPNLRVVLNAGHPRLLRRWQEELSTFAPNASQVTGWGLTETGGLCAVGRPTDSLDARVDSIGIPFPGTEVAAVDPETHRPLKPGEIGELVVRGRTLFNGYWGQAQQTSSAHLDDGWFMTGDQGAIDSGGYVRFVGRLRDALKVGGENVSAAEIEAVLVSHPAVAEAQVVGVPDARLGEVAAAYIKPVAAAGWSEPDLVAYCALHLAPFKVPRYIREIDEWPMSATKVRKADLKRRFTEELGLDPAA